MRHDVPHLSNLLDRKLTEIRDKNGGSLETVNDSFVYAFGPFMSMEPGFEHECDDIANFSDPMRVILFAAYLIRRITSGISYGEAKKLIKDFIIEVDNTFPESTHKRIHDSIIQFAIDYKNSLRVEQGTNLESFMTNSAPIVPYQGMMKKQLMEPGMETRIDCVDAVQKVIVDANQSRSGNQDTLMAILLGNLAGIMKWKDLTTVIEDPATGANNLLELDHLIIDKGEIPHAVRAYYFLATINYYGLPIEIFDKYLRFFKEMGDFSKQQSYDAFEAMVDEMAETVNPNIATESWEDPEMEKKAEELYQNQITMNVKQEHKMHDFNAFLNFAALHRNIRFDEHAKRLFAAEVHDRKIVNVNNMHNGMTIYELDNGTMVCPYVDIIDWQVRLLYARQEEDRLLVCPLGDFPL